MANLISAIILFSMSVLLILLPSMRASFKVFSVKFSVAKYIPILVVVLTSGTCIVIGVLLAMNIFTVVFS